MKMKKRKKGGKLQSMENSNIVHEKERFLALIPSPGECRA
jgi:hypothetical protein